MSTPNVCAPTLIPTDRTDQVGTDQRADQVSTDRPAGQPPPGARAEPPRPDHHEQGADPEQRVPADGPTVFFAELGSSAPGPVDPPRSWTDRVPSVAHRTAATPAPGQRSRAWPGAAAWPGPAARPGCTARPAEAGHPSAAGTVHPVWLGHPAGGVATRPGGFTVQVDGFAGSPGGHSAGFGMAGNGFGPAACWSGPASGGFGYPVPPRRRRGVAVPVLLTLLVSALVMIGGVIGLVRFVLDAAIADAGAMAPPGPAASAGPRAGRPLGAAAAERLVDQVAPGLVDIEARLPGDHYMAGTGIVLDPNGLVMTNNHVIAGQLDMVVTDIGNNRHYRAVLVGADPAHDVAVIRLGDASGLTTAVLGDSDSVRIGDQVAAIGNAGGAGGRPSVGTGPVTGLSEAADMTDEHGGDRQHLANLISATDGVRPGDSGGALVDTDGLVVGMNVAGGVDGPHRSPNGEGMAIRINDALGYAHRIVDHVA